MHTGIRYQRLSAVLPLGSRGNALRNQVDVQNSFCIYIWHPVQECGWFCVDASVDERVDGKVDASVDAVVDERVDGIVDGGVDGIGYAFGYAIVDASVDEIGDAAVYPSVDAGGDKTVDASVYGIVSGSVNVCVKAPCMLSPQCGAGLGRHRIMCSCSTSLTASGVCQYPIKESGCFLCQASTMLRT